MLDNSNYLVICLAFNSFLVCGHADQGHNFKHLEKVSPHMYQNATKMAEPNVQHICDG